MPTTIDIRELGLKLEEVLAVVAAGGEVVVADGGTPRARLVALEVPRQRVAGLHAGAIRPASDFDAPLPDDFWTGRP